MAMRRFTPLCAAVWFSLLVAMGGRGQTLSPPIAEYRQKANGMLTLGNNGDTPLVAILEIQSFSVDNEGNVKYSPADPKVNVQLGSNSFTIPPHQVHYVFYKASCAQAPCWFAVVNTLTQPTRVNSGLRINIILPHLVYVYQKAKLKKNDLRVEVSSADKAGRYELKFTNLSGKLERVETIQFKGFRARGTVGGFPLFPGGTRSVTLDTGLPAKKPLFQIHFGGGLRLDIPLLELRPTKVAPG
jgi:hypothetical protein